MRLIRISAGLVAVAALLPVATAPASASAVQPKGTPVIVISSEGGFVAPGYIKSSLPSLVGYSNGAVLMRFDSAKRPDLREMRLRFVDPATLRALAAAIAKTAVVPAGAVTFVDTMNRAAPAVDENASRDMGKIIEGTKALQSLIA